MKQTFRYIYLLIFFSVSNDVKAKGRISFDSSPSYITRFISVFKEKGSRYIVLPFSSKINFRTFYDFDLGLRQEYGIFLSRSFCDGHIDYEPFFSAGASQTYYCKNESTSFCPRFYFCLSKRKIIKKISERVDFCFDFSLSFLSFGVVFLTKDGPSFKFFHLPECKKAEDGKKRGGPFRLYFDYITPYYWFLKTCTDQKLEALKNGSVDIENVEKYFAFLYWFASCFTFWFDVRICSYLFCCIKIPIISVFELFFLFRYLFLKKECEELLVEYHKKEEGGEKNALVNLLYIKEDRRASMLIVVRKKFPLLLLSQILNFSIRF